MLVAIGNASPRLNSDPPACTISGTPNGSPDLVFRSKLSMREGSPHRAAVALALVLEDGFGFALIRIARPSG